MRTKILDLFLSFYVKTKQPDRRKRNDQEEYDDISLKNKPELELTCRYRIGIPNYIDYYDSLSDNQTLIDALLLNLNPGTAEILMSILSYL